MGCPGTTPDGSSFDNFACVTAGPSSSSQTYTVHFPAPGNFKLICLVHQDMTGVVHVLNVSQALPNDQNAVDRQAANERAVLQADAARLAGRGDSGDADEVRGGKVTAGIGEIVTTTGAGSQTVSVVRFLQGTIVVRVGDTVEWTNLDPSIPHTVTFGIEPADPRSASTNLSTDSDGAGHAVIGSPADSVNSGRLLAAPQDRPGLTQSAPGATRFRVTFTDPGTFNYICSLHDDLGMRGPWLFIRRLQKNEAALLVVDYRWSFLGRPRVYCVGAGTRRWD